MLALSEAALELTGAAWFEYNFRFKLEGEETSAGPVGALRSLLPGERTPPEAVAAAEVGAAVRMRREGLYAGRVLCRALCVVTSAVLGWRRRLDAGSQRRPPKLGVTCAEREQRRGAGATGSGLASKLGNDRIARKRRFLNEGNAHPF